MSGDVPEATLSSRLAAVIVADLISHGVRDFVVCPGSRSQALALAAAEAEQLGVARLHVRVDERSAAFFALGIARETGLPAPIIVTSGSAVANLMPAVLEAHSARVPMLLLTADRPSELHGVRSSQTVWDNMYTLSFSRFSAEIPAAEAHDLDEYLGEIIPHIVQSAFSNATRHCNGAGPAHLNVAFRDPLSGGSGLLGAALEHRAQHPVETYPYEDHESVAERAALVACEICGPEPDATEACRHERATELDVYVHGEGRAADPPRAVIIAGSDAGPEAEAFAHATGLPLLAEPTSGARFGREAIQHWVQLLDQPDLAEAIELVIVFGNPNLTRHVPALIQRVPTVVIDPTGPDGPERGIERINPGRSVTTFALTATVADDYDPNAVRSWLGRWVIRDRELRAQHTTVHEPDLEAARATGYKERNAYARAEVARMREPITREHLAETLWLATWPHDRLVVASSRLIRVLNRMAAPRNIRVHANRGLAGIDGTIATALGIAQASQHHENPKLAAGTTRVLIGDLALFHDAGSLALPPESEGVPRIQLLVGNDGGGTIFDMLEVAGSADRDMFDRVMFTPQRVDIAQLAGAYGWTYRRAENRGELEQVFTTPVAGPEIVEVPLSR